MGKSYKSPAKIRRDIMRILEYKVAFLEDCWDSDVFINENLEIIWNASTSLKLTLAKGAKIVETREFYNPAFPKDRFHAKLCSFQNMWKPDQQSLNFFACMHHHLKRSSIECDHFCTSFSSPYCGRLSFFLSKSKWPEQ